jgi:hypothetical protein
MRVRSLWLTVLALFTLVGFASAGTIAPALYADTAPNVYGSPNWGPWWTQAKADVAAGTFVNMRSGKHPGTTYFEPKEAIVYSTMDLGKRLHWIYWIPGVTKDDLNGLFEVNNTVDWAGKEYLWGETEYAGGVPDSEWYQPTKWENYDKDEDGTTDGVIGTFGNAWWADETLADPGYDGDGSVYNDVDPADVEALAKEVLRNQTHWTGWIRYRPSVNDDWTYVQLRLQVVPEPGTMVLWLSGFAAPVVALLRRRK